MPVGVRGELHIAGQGVTIGYLNAPQLTAQRFVVDPFVSTPGARMYATGDLARQPGDGAIELCGRLDDQVKVRGYRVEPRETAAVLSEHPAVTDTVVVVRHTPGDTPT